MHCTEKLSILPNICRISLDFLCNCPETLALVSFSFPTILFLGGLTILHAFLLARNQTGYENFRQSYMRSQNPFDRGMPSNIMEVLFEPWPPSRVDFRAEVMMPRGFFRLMVTIPISIIRESQKQSAWGPLCRSNECPHPHQPPATSHQPPVLVNGVAETTCYMWSRPEGWGASC
ncbi:S-ACYLTRANSFERASE [Salix purpurea]|uniref:S-ACYLTRANSFERASE n=1 Tax=Salix purpurea TaxID=77065 RepID=A0A9Q0P2N4_SALPP|nr:S-ACYLTRANSFERASE [Salix purpurea]